MGKPPSRPGSSAGPQPVGSAIPQNTLPIWMLTELVRPRQRPVTNVVAVFVTVVTFAPLVIAHALARCAEGTSSRN